MRALPPGSYVAAAVEALEKGSESDPAFQATLRTGGRRFVVAEGQTVTLTLDLAPRASPLNARRYRRGSQRDSPFVG